MLSYAADFWPWFWTILGTAALLTVALSLLVATLSPAWFRPHRRHQPAQAPAGPPAAAEPAARQPGPGYQADRTAKAA